MNFVKTSLKYRQVTLTILVMVFAMGVYSLFTMPRREDPKLTVPQGLLVAWYPGATAAQVEEQVTKKLEKYLFQYEEVYKAKTYSTTRNGIVVITVWLNDDVKKPEIFWSKLRHQLLIAKSLDLPAGVIGPVVNSDFGDTEAMLISIESDTASYAQLTEYAKLLENKIRTISATSKIKRLGEQKEQVSIYFDPDKLSQYNISLQQIIKVIQSQNTPGAAGEIRTGNNDVAIYNSGYYANISDLSEQIVSTSETGEVVRLHDIAEIKREAADPVSDIKVNGHKAILVSVQMTEGNNIVWFGKDVNKVIKELSGHIPSNVRLTTIVNQPVMVQENVSNFLREFFIAIISVIIVIILLLPFRVASVAAMAIPMTIATTFMLLHVFGIELHQVSLISLIVVLGMVVDDAIVVTDNYVELLDKGFDRWTAAWRSAYDLVVPIFTATITIIASFMPMIILSGAIGEFVHDLPVTVSIALASSFIVAMVLTPTLCFFFIRKGLHGTAEGDSHPQGKKSVFLDLMQKGYDKAIDWCAVHHRIVIMGSLLLIGLAVILFKSGVRQRFMPFAERNQFVVELWMPTGTQLDKTKETISRVENEIKQDKRLVSCATFCGTSAPRVYYNFAPEFPVSNYAQILINTADNESTESFAGELSGKLEKIIPEGTVSVKLMQQGQPMIAPIEIRIYGDDISKLKETASQIKEIVKSKNGSRLVEDDFKEDYYGLNLKPRSDAGRLGFTSSGISQAVYVAFKGYTVSTMNEGDKSIDIVLRTVPGKRASAADLEDLYLESPVTGAKVPLRQIASITPEWQNGNIMHRNGMRCLTVRSETCKNILPSELLSEIKPEIEKLPIPQGYSIEYGGEQANKAEVMSHLVIALVISLIAIFIILLLQFRNLKETFIVMLTIPLSLFGAVLGLYVTGNNFGLTAFMGIISLSGIVVRNAIILIDHANELISNGSDIRTAAIESGKRRLRPIFLTAMAAAVGVLPMIISGSSLWSPLASVIAFGVTWSMIMALLTVPVLYIMIIKPEDKQLSNEGRSDHKVKIISFSALVLFLLASSLMPVSVKAQQTPVRINLQKIQDMAVENNRLMKIKQMQVDEKEQKINEDRVKFLPSFTISSTYQLNSNLPELTIDKGTFGVLPLQYQMPDGSIKNVNVELPSEDKTMKMGDHNTCNASAVFYQPVSQLPKIKAAVDISRADLAITVEEKAKAGIQLKLGVERIYYGLLILQKQLEEAELNRDLALTKLKEAEDGVNAGKAMASATVGLNAELANRELEILKMQIQIDDLTTDLKQLAGIPDTVLLQIDTIPSVIDNSRDYSFSAVREKATAGNADLKIADFTLSKAENAMKACRSSYLPDFGVLGGYSFQKGNTLFPQNNAFLGVTFKWDIQEMYSNSFVRKQRTWQVRQAEENLINSREQLNTDLMKTVRRIHQNEEILEVAAKVARYRQDDFQVQTDKKAAGLNVESEYLAAKAALAKAEADMYAAQLNYRLALSDMQILMGEY